MQFREYEPDNDQAAAHRVWREVGWIRPGEEPRVDALFEGSNVLVADLNGQPECFVARGTGTVRHLETDLPFVCIEAVTTSRIARKQGLAGRLTAQSIAQGALQGAAVVGLGMFEQGYYDRLGFGSGSYDIWISFDPADLLVDAEFGIPERLCNDDWEAVHASRLAATRGHGACTITPPSFTAAHMALGGDTFGLGYRDFDGNITHHLWIQGSGEQGPYSVRWMAYRNRQQFIELMALLKAFGDQIRLVRMYEPPGIQLASLLRYPKRSALVTRGSDFQVQAQAIPWWQMRICDVPAAMAGTKLPVAEPMRLNVELTDPIEKYLDDECEWRGVGGSYIVALGPESSAESGSDDRLPTLKASVNAFTRLWLGVAPASGLSITDELAADEDLLNQLDSVVRLPRPSPCWPL